MIYNTPNEKKPLPKIPLMIGAITIAVAAGFFFFSSNNEHNSLVTPTTISDTTSVVSDNIDVNKTTAELQLPKIAYNDALSVILQRTLSSIEPSKPLVIISKKIIASHFNFDIPSVLSQQNKVIALKVKSGDSLSTLFKKAGLSATALQNILTELPEAKKHLTQLRIGQSFVFTMDSNGRLLSLVSKPSLTETFTIYRQDKGYFFKETIIKPTYKEFYAYGVINSSLFTAADKANVPHNMIIEIANAFGYDIDFALDLRQGDEFEAIFEKKYVNGRFVGTGNLLAARFVNRGKEYTAVRYETAKGLATYYRADGTSMRRAFIRTPVDFTRISSKFTSSRYHPVLNKIRAHTGVDYAAPIGTIIKSAGDGRIIERGKKGGYGNTIVIQHGKNYTTLYAHMSRFIDGLKVGSHVKQGQTIGYVGMSGLATGPHLHYEFRVNGKHVDPLSVNLPMADPLSGTAKIRFLEISKPLMAKMRQNRSTMVAKAEDQQVKSNMQ